ncbi:MAG TPA: hydrogenase iron-sulfur subunit [Anaerolineae bacterium]|nr:hydrogenase iron-sulfur subunit [Anaerolineae bacterium]
MIRSDELDRGFVEEILAEPGGEHLLDCWSCGTCAATCLVRRYEPSFNPRLILHKAGLGLREEVLSSAEIWQCSACDACYPRCPKEIHISDVMKAIRNIAIREGYERPGVTAEVDVSTCVACGICSAACPYEAISLQTVVWQRKPRRAAQVDRTLCVGCGTCNSVCPSSSISVEGYTDLECHDSLVDASYAARPPAGADWRGIGLVIVCDWCLHAASDVEYASHPPEGIKVINVSCSGRVTPAFVTTALQRGVDSVLIVGCKEDECHYKQGSTIAGGRMAMLQSFLDLLGVERGRVQFARLGSLDRGKFPRLVDKMAKDVHALASLTRGN